MILQSRHPLQTFNSKTKFMIKSSLKKPFFKKTKPSISASPCFPTNIKWNMSIFIEWSNILLDYRVCMNYSEGTLESILDTVHFNYSWGWRHECNRLCSWWWESSSLGHSVCLVLCLPDCQGDLLLTAGNIDLGFQWHGWHSSNQPDWKFTGCLQDRITSFHSRSSPSFHPLTVSTVPLRIYFFF